MLDLYLLSEHFLGGYQAVCTMLINSIHCIDFKDGIGKMECPKVYKRDPFTVSVKIRGIWLEAHSTSDLCLLYCKSSAFRAFEGEPYKLNVLAAFVSPTSKQYKEFSDPVQVPLNTTPHKLSFFITRAADNKLCQITGKAVIEISGQIDDSLLL